jgi:hypothetical protein
MPDLLDGHGFLLWEKGTMKIARNCNQGFGEKIGTASEGD